jgi:hypothetical protein
MNKLMVILLSVFLVGCSELFAPKIEILTGKEFLVIIESNTSWVGKIDTFTVRGDSIKWFKVNRPGICWEITQANTVGMTRAYGTTPNFTYGWSLEEAKYPMWGDMNTIVPGGVIRGCIPEDAKY